jgi:hypothetical protein
MIIIYTFSVLWDRLNSSLVLEGVMKFGLNRSNFWGRLTHKYQSDAQRGHGLESG